MQQATAVLHSPPVFWAPQLAWLSRTLRLLDLDLGQQLSAECLPCMCKGLGSSLKKESLSLGHLDASCL